MKRATFAIHPGQVKSNTDGDIHHIGFAQLVKLYRLPVADCFLWSDDVSRTAGLNPDNYVHLYPRTDGDYEGARERASQEFLASHTETINEGQ